MDLLFQTFDLKFLDVISYPDLTIEACKTTFIAGDSGTGKSTLLKLFNGVNSLSAGKILYKGQNLAELDTLSLRQEVLLISQQVYLFDELTIEQNFAEYYSYRALPPPDQEKTEHFLRLCMADFPLNAMCANLSGGERQRVFNAIFTSFEPPVLMLDEPTAALDEANAVQFLKNIHTQCRGACGGKGISLIIVSHDHDLVADFADQTIVLEGNNTQGGI